MLFGDMAQIIFTKFRQSRGATLVFNDIYGPVFYALSKCFGTSDRKHQIFSILI
jgi:hypothetical protein